jgi:hypothetical protein
MLLMGRSDVLNNYVPIELDYAEVFLVVPVVEPFPYHPPQSITWNFVSFSQYGQARSR